MSPELLVHVSYPTVRNLASSDPLINCKGGCFPIFSFFVFSELRNVSTGSKLIYWLNDRTELFLRFRNDSKVEQELDHL